MTAWTTLRAAAPWRVRELTRLDADLRTRHALSVRVGVVGVQAGAGTSTVAGTMGALLAERSADRVLLVDTTATGAALRHAGLAQAQAPTSAPMHAERFDQVAASVPRVPGGVYGLALAPGDNAWWQVVAPAVRFFDVVVSDWGARGLGDLGPVVASSSVVCLVTPARLGPIQLAVNLAGAVRAAGAAPVVCVNALDAHPPAGIGTVCDLLPFPVARFSHEPASRRARPGRGLPLGVRMSAMRAAAAVMTAATTQVPARVPVGGSS